MAETERDIKSSQENSFSAPKLVRALSHSFEKGVLKKVGWWKQNKAGRKSVEIPPEAVDEEPRTREQAKGEVASRKGKAATWHVRFTNIN